METITINDLMPVANLGLQMVFMVPKNSDMDGNPFGIQYNLNTKTYFVNKLYNACKFIPFDSFDNNDELAVKMVTDLINRKFSDESLTHSIEELNSQYNKISATFDIESDIKKARSGVYADTPENRKLKRVGKEYGTKKEADESEDEDEKEIPIHEHAKTASGTALERAAKEAKDPETRIAAHNEIDRRSKEEAIQEPEEKTKKIKKGGYESWL